MALTKTVINKKIYFNIENSDDTIEKEVSYPSAYIKITRIEGNKDLIKLKVTLYIDVGKNEIITEQFYRFKPFVADGSTNFIQQGYEYLKTLPEYADAVDC